MPATGSIPMTNAGTLEPIDELGCDDADHARRPALAADHDRGAGIVLVDPREDLGHHAILDRAALGVRLLERGRARRRGVRLGEQQRERWLRGAEPTGRIDPRRELPRDGPRVDLAIRLDPGRREQRRDSRPHAARQPAQSERRQDPVLGGERHEVRDRSERDEIEQVAHVGHRPRPVPVAIAELGPHRRSDVEHQAHRRHPRNGNVESLPERVDQRERGMRHAGRRHRVMIDHDHFHAERRGRIDRIEIARTAVAGDDELAVARREVRRRRGREAIPSIAPRDRDLDVRTRRTQERRQQRRGGHAVDVVVAEHADALAALDCIRDPLDRARHPGEPRRRPQCRQPRIDEALRVARLGHAARDETSCGRAANAQGLRQSAHEPFIERSHSYLHAHTLVRGSDTEPREIPSDPGIYGVHSAVALQKAPATLCVHCTV